MSTVIELLNAMILSLMSGLKLLAFAHLEEEWVWQLLVNFCMQLVAMMAVHH